MIKTLVTSQLVTKIAHAYQALVIDDLLVGFKYIGDVLDQIELKGSWQAQAVKLDDFVIGLEESHGFLLTTAMRDKDAAGAAVVLAELTDELVAAGQTVDDYLSEIYQLYGYHGHLAKSFVLPGAKGSGQIAQIMSQLRAQPANNLAGRKVEAVFDYQDQASYGPYLSQTDKASRNLLVYQLTDGLQLVVRPSGTEAKIKLYFEIAADRPATNWQRTCDRLETTLAQFANQVLLEFLALLGIKLPLWGLAISELVPLETKQAFCQDFMPAFEQRAQLDSVSDLTTWAQAQLGRYQQPSKAPFEAAFGQYLATQASSPRLVKQEQAWRVLN